MKKILLIYKFIVLLLGSLVVYYFGNDYPLVVYLAGVFVGSTLNAK